ncbi:universal stress protein family protein [Kribbella amoyensis]|uniref:Universal stress protein family protein n=1 Tax=Kribbella amoyensis TaxID=996641 RepID=A0A561BYW8_9ACTN|nr:universal stress protein [Kribbella amoyensis]TWD84064.1 universal stress protein family protein [Kribbella amoyensis]
MVRWTRSGPIVVEVDGTPAGRRVVEYASHEALRTGAELVLVAPTQPFGFTETEGPTPTDNLRSAARWVRELTGSGVAITTLLARGSRLKVLAETAQHARLLVIGRTPLRGPQRLVTAHGDLFLATRTGCPVLVVPSGWRPSDLDRRISVGVDGTAMSLEAVEFAMRAAADRGGDLTLVHSQHTPRHLSLVPPEPRSGEELSVAETLADWGSRYPQVKLTRFLTTRPVADVLVEEGHQAGLVVIGTPAGLLPIGDPGARRSVVSMNSPLAVVPHHAAAHSGAAAN